MEPFVLLEIARGPVHGYEIAHSLGGLGFRRVVEDQSVLYKLLRTFEDEGIATSAWDVGESGPPRRLYRLTSKGHEYLAQRADDMERQRARIETFLDRFSKIRRKRTGNATRATSRAIERPLAGGSGEERPRSPSMLRHRKRAGVPFHEVERRNKRREKRDE